MQKGTRLVASRLGRLASSGLAFLALALGVAGAAQAQEIEPNEFVAAPAGTNIVLGYYIYGHDTTYNIAHGPTFKDSGVEINVGLARYVHFFDVAGHPAVLQILQSFGSLSGAHVDSARVGSAFGAQDTQLAASFWPYSNEASKTYVVTTLNLYPPDGTYDPASPINLGDNRWSGNAQIGLSRGIGAHFSFDAAFDATIYGDNDQYVPGSRRESQTPLLRGQLWLNWAWSRAFQTSLGWEGFFNGRQQVNGTFTGATGEEQRIRAAASLFVTPTVQTVLELNHDVERTGGFKQDFGLTLRLLKIF